MKNAETIAQRGMNARNAFASSIAEQFGFSEKEGLSITNALISLKAARVDYGVGQVKLSHGAFWDKAVMQRALEA